MFYTFFTVFFFAFGTKKGGFSVTIHYFHKNFLNAKNAEKPLKKAGKSGMMTPWFENEMVFPKSYPQPVGIVPSTGIFFSAHWGGTDTQ